MKASSNLTFAISVVFDVRVAGKVGRWGTGVRAESREERRECQECRECARGEDMRDKGAGGGTVTSTSLSHSVPTRSREPGMVPNPLLENCSQSVGVSGEAVVGAVLLFAVRLGATWAWRDGGERPRSVRTGLIGVSGRENERDLLEEIGD